MKDAGSLAVSSGTGPRLPSTKPEEYRVEVSFPTADRQIPKPLHKTIPSGVEVLLTFKKGFRQNEGHLERRECLSPLLRMQTRSVFTYVPRIPACG